MADKKKKPSGGLTKTGKVSRSIRKTPHAKYKDRQRLCPNCGANVGNNIDYDYDEEKKEITYFYCCKECGQTFRCVRTMSDLCKM